MADVLVKLSTQIVGLTPFNYINVLHRALYVRIIGQHFVINISNATFCLLPNGQSCVDVKTKHLIRPSFISSLERGSIHPVGLDFRVSCRRRSPSGDRLELLNS